MDMNKIRPASDAAWYCRKDAEEERFYEIFFQLCRKYSVRWASATPKEKSFIEEVTRVTYERDRAQRLGLPPEGGRTRYLSKSRLAAIIHARPSPRSRSRLNSAQSRSCWVCLKASTSRYWHMPTTISGICAISRASTSADASASPGLRTNSL